MTGIGTGPTTALGQVNASALGGVAAWSGFVDQQERTPELLWPNSVAAFELMRTDAQVNGLLSAMTLPITRYRWSLDPNGCRPDVLQGIAEDTGLPIVGQEDTVRGRTKGKFSHAKHLEAALLALVFGHNYFEQVGIIEDSPRLWWRLRKLEARLPRTLAAINVAPDGGLVSIKQNLGWQAPEIPVDRLVAYVWGQEPGNWIGRSMLRPMYKHWLCKDRLLRIDTMKHERNGLGMPVAEAPRDATDGQLARLSVMMQKWKAGEAAGGAVPAGTKVSLVGTSGSIPDTIASIRYHDELMARSGLMMFMQLGQTETGSRALGDSFIDFFALAQDAVASWYADVFNEHVLEDWVDFNVGTEEQAPLLVYERDPDPTLAIADLALMVERGLIVVDEEIRTFLRERYRLPEQGEAVLLPAGATPPAPVQGSGRRVTARQQRVQRAQGLRAQARRDRDAIAAVITSPNARTVHRHRLAVAEARVAAPRSAADPLMPDRTLRRKPNRWEVQAKTDFARMDAVWQDARDRLTAEWLEKVSPDAMDELVEQIGNAESLADLADLKLEPMGVDLLVEHMTAVSEDAMTAAIEEAIAQGAEAPVPDEEALAEVVQARAEAMAQQIADGLTGVAYRRALMAWTGDAAAAAASVRSHFDNDMTDAGLRDMLGGSLSQAQGDGRRSVFDAGGDEGSSYYSSELLDEATCDPCRAKDETEYDTLAATATDYPTGGFIACKGQFRCRGAIIKIYGDEGTSEDDD